MKNKKLEGEKGINESKKTDLDLQKSFDLLRKPISLPTQRVLPTKKIILKKTEVKEPTIKIERKIEKSEKGVLEKVEKPEKVEKSILENAFDLLSTPINLSGSKTKEISRVQIEEEKSEISQISKKQEEVTLVNNILEILEGNQNIESEVEKPTEVKKSTEVEYLYSPSNIMLKDLELKELGEKKEDIETQVPLVITEKEKEKIEELEKEKKKKEEEEKEKEWEFKVIRDDSGFIESVKVKQITK